MIEEKGISQLFMKRRTVGTTNQSVSAPYLLRSWNRFSWNTCQNIQKTGKLRQPTQLHQGQIIPD